MAVAAVVATLVLLTPSAAAQSDGAPLVVAIGSTSRTLANGDIGTVSFPVEVVRVGSSGDPRIEIRAVRRDEVAISSSVITVALNDEEVIFTVADDHKAAFRIAGTYTIELVVGSDEGVRQSLEFSLIRSAAVVEEVATIEVDQVTGWLAGWQGWFDQDGAGEIDLAVGRGAPLSRLSARQKEQSPGQVVLAAGCIGGADTSEQACELASAEPVQLATPGQPDGVLTVDYEVEDFDLGQSTRTVELRSPDLAEPVTLTFEVVRRRTPLLIPLIVVGGVLIGLVARVVVVEIMNWLRVRRVQSELDARIRKVKDTRGDPQLEQELDEIQERLGKIKKLADVEALQAKAHQALEAADNRLAEARTALTMKSQVVAGALLLPPSVEQAAQRYRAELDGVAERLTAKDGFGAAQHLEAMVADQQLRDQAEGWIADYLDEVSTLANEIHDIDTDSPVIGSLLRSLELVAGIPGDEQGADLRTRLETCSRLVRDWNDDVETKIVAAIDDRRDRDTDLAAQLDADLAEGLDPALRAGTIRSDLVALLGKEQPEIVLETQRQPTGPVERVAAGSVADVGVPPLPLPVVDQLGFGAQRFVSLAVGWGLSLLRGLGLVVALAVVAYVTRADDWIGDAEQMVALFGWAFALELSAEAVTSALGSRSDGGG